MCYLPAFSDFYDDLIAEGLVGEDDSLPKVGESKGDMISVGLKEDFETYYVYWIEIVQDEIVYPTIDVEKLAPYTYSSETEKNMLWIYKKLSMKKQHIHQTEVDLRKHF